jgi:(1->4)-alpha-D-glucan 1-alpha-D-glucosylmutase
MDNVDDLFRRALGRAASLRRLPESTYRVQFHKGFTFRDAAAIVPYLAELGVTHLYASPYLKAVPGSTHGYDVIDHNRLNPEVGTEQDYEALIEALRSHGMSHVLDTVPNHVGVATNENAWWNDVLEHGRRSRYADYFDIAWRGSPRPELHDKVLLPLLGGLYGDVLEKGELKLVREDGKLWVRYYQRRFPINPETFEQAGGDVESFNGRPGEPRSFDKLDALLNRQHYRLAYWRVAPDEINYRRFFDVNDLAALAMEREEVFEAAHALTLRLLAEGKVGGLRIDHPDGLYDPKQYFRRLQGHFLLACARHEYTGDDWPAARVALLERIDRHLAKTPPTELPLYVVAEKILAVDEPFPQTWAAHGTSGYDFLIMANSLFVDSSNEEAFTRLYQDFTGQATAFEDLVYEKKRLILRVSLASELHMLARRLDRLAQRHRGWRDFTLGGLIDALREVIACFPVYRSYVSASDGVNEVDVQRIEHAVDEAIRRNARTEPAVFHFIRDALLQRYPETFTDDDKAAQLAFAGKFQQVTSPATAKGIEDTAFYVYNRLVSLNEVGGEPGRFGIPPDALHRYLEDRQKLWPHALSAMSTHDTKRSEDVRARLNVLSEIPDEWRERVRQWASLNARHRADVNGAPAPHPNDEYLVYQTLLGAWPLEPAAAGEVDAFIDRVQAYLRKAMREAKVRTTWTDPNEAYESAVLDFAAKVARDEPFLADFRPFHRRVSRLGLLNSLSQTLLRLTAPGVPDTYQGCELWDFSLVDPDNRRPVDYAKRVEMLRHLGEAPNVAELVASMPDGRIKLYLTRQVLRLRRDVPGLFTSGEYVPVAATGPRAANVFAYQRRLGRTSALVVVPRLVSQVTEPNAWRGTTLQLPDAPWPVRNPLTGETVDVSGRVALEEVLKGFPVGLLVSA